MTTLPLVIHNYRWQRGLAPGYMLVIAVHLIHMSLKSFHQVSMPLETMQRQRLLMTHLCTAMVPVDTGETAWGAAGEKERDTAATGGEPGEVQTTIISGSSVGAAEEAAEKKTVVWQPREQLQGDRGTQLPQLPGRPGNIEGEYGTNVAPVGRPMT